MTKKLVLVAAAAGALAVGAAPSTAAPVHADSTAIKAAPGGVTQVHYQKHRTVRHQVLRERGRNAAAQTWGPNAAVQTWGPAGLPFAAAEGAVELGAAAVGTGLGIAGNVVGGTAAALTGTRYGYGAYGTYDYAPGAYGSYAYAPGYAGYGYAPASGLGHDIGHSYYNGSGSPAPASQDNCAVDGGYGRKDYSLAC